MDRSKEYYRWLLEVWRALGLSQIRVEQLSSLRREVDIRQARVVPKKHSMSALMLSLNNSETKAEAIPLHMHQGHKEK